MAKQFSLRGMLMVFFPTRLTVNSFMRWRDSHTVAVRRMPGACLN